MAPDHRQGPYGDTPCGSVPAGAVPQRQSTSLRLDISAIYLMSQTPVRDSTAQPSHRSRQNGMTRSLQDGFARTGALSLTGRSDNESALRPLVTGIDGQPVDRLI